MGQSDKEAYSYLDRQTNRVGGRKKEHYKEEVTKGKRKSKMKHSRDANSK